MEFLFIAVIVLVVIFAVRGHERSKEHVHAWAERNDLRVESISLRLNPVGPFMFRSRAQRAYNVTFFDDEGRARRAVVRVGGFWAGALSDEVRVHWRDP